MLLGEIIGKEVIDLQGRKIGKIKKADLILEASSGRVESIILHNKLNKFVIPWYGIKQIGSRVVIVDNSIKYNKQHDL
ncbi:MAG: PRC-barrel domain-containing protein [bacterium]